MDKATELSFGLDTVRRSAEFKLGKLVRRSGLLSLASWIKGGGRNILSISVPPSPGQGLVIEGIHSREGEPSLPWDLVETRGRTSLAECPTAPYGANLCVQEGLVRAQVAPDPVLVVRRGPDAPRIDIRLAGRTETIDLKSEHTAHVALRPGRSPMLSGQAVVPAKVEPADWTPEQHAFVETTREQRLETVVVYVPRWLGVSNSTRGLFGAEAALYPVPPDRTLAPWELTEADIEQHADVIAATGASRVIFSGGDEVHHRLMVALHRRDPSIRFDLVFHGNFTQLQDPYVWSIFNLWIAAAREGLLHTFVTVKKGAEDVLRAMGVRSELLLNYVPGPTLEPPRLPPFPPRIGVWTSGTVFKSVDPMLAAIKLIPDAVLHAAGIGEHGVALAECLGLPVGFMSATPVRTGELPGRMRETHLSLYVTFAECSPMLPLESLQAGVPCLVGPSSHLFEDERYLADRLIVPYPDRPDIIAACALRVLEERDQIMHAWSRYAVQYNAQAQERVRRFLRGSAPHAPRPQDAVAWR